MRILLSKLSDQRHVLEIVRADATRETIELVTRESLFHDLLHYAVESSLPTQSGFWGTLASGKTMADLNDRSGKPVADNAAILQLAEGIVGVMSGVIGMPGDQAFAKLCWFSEKQNQAPPGWCTEHFVADVSECMRRLLGRWKATAFGKTMEIEWTED